MKDHDRSPRKCAPALSRRGALGALALGAALPGCLHQVLFAAPPVRDGAVRVPAAELSQLKGPADVLFVRADGAPGTIAVRREGEGYLALLALCTHRGCELQALPQSYDCPCHGSRFDVNGEVIEGPAERPLDRLPLRLAGDDLSISVR